MYYYVIRRFKHNGNWIKDKYIEMTPEEARPHIFRHEIMQSHHQEDVHKMLHPEPAEQPKSKGKKTNAKKSKA